MYFEIFFLLLVTYFSYQIFIKVAIKFNLLDFPNARSSHKVPTVRGFGIVIFISIGITLLVFYPALFIENSNILSAILLISLLGLVDDIIEIPPFVKILTLVVVYMFLYAEGFLITDLGIFLGIDLNLNTLIAIIFSIVAIVIFTNAFNFIDGLDGLSGLISIIIFISFLVIGTNNNDHLLILISAFFVTSLSVFMFYNWHPAKIFLGDSGSLMIGFVISILAIKSLNYIEPISILFITSVPIIDILFVTIIRLLNKKSIFHADRMHCHHVLLSYFNNNIKKTVIIIALFQFVSSLIGVIFISKVNDSFIALMVFIIIFFIVYKILNKLRIRDLN